MINPELVKAVRTRFTLDWHGYHGVLHWTRVRANGIRLAEATGARTDVVEVFSFIHDSCRNHDGRDPDHGRRAADFADTLRGNAIHLDDQGFDLLVEACMLHSDGVTEGDITVQVCFDADRLDLGRVGMRPDPRYLCTRAAKQPSMIEWAYARSVRCYV